MEASSHNLKIGFNNSLVVFAELASIVEVAVNEQCAAVSERAA